MRSYSKTSQHIVNKGPDENELNNMAPIISIQLLEYNHVIIMLTILNITAE